MTVKHIKHHSPAEIAQLATHPAGIPTHKTMQPKWKTTITKANYFAGLPFFNGISKDATYKSNGDKAKIHKKWRKFDLPPKGLTPHGEMHLHAMLARAEHRNATLIPSAAAGVLEQTGVRLAQLEHEAADLSAALNGVDLDDPAAVLSAEQRELAKQLGTIKQRLAGQQSLHNSAQDKLAGDSIAPQRDAAAQALAALGGEVVSDQAKAAYTAARDQLIKASTEHFFNAYCALRETEGDQARAKGMKTMLEPMARQLELPTKYLDGLEALPIAEEILDNVAMAPADKAQAKAELYQQLVGQRVLDLTAGRTDAMPGTPPTREEAALWQQEADKLKALSGDFASVEQLLGQTMPDLKRRADAAQAQMMDDLIAHLPTPNMSPAQREETSAALRELATKLSAAGSLQKDAPLAAMQLMHVVSMAEAVTGQDPARSVALYKALANEHVHNIVGTAAEQMQMGEPLHGTARDLAKMWEMSSHVVPEAVNSLLACNPQNKQVDWRDVQSFFRCTQEFDKPETSHPHKEKMKVAANALRQELVDGVKPELGSPARRDWAMVKSAVWKQENTAHVSDTLNDFHTTLALPGTLVKQMHGQFDKKGRGNVTGEAREAFKETLGHLKDFAKTALEQASTPKQKEDAKVLAKLAEYIASHRGTEKTFTKATRFLTQKEGTFNSGKEIWSNPLKAKEKQAILSSIGLSTPGKLDHPSLAKANEGHGALDLLREAVALVGTPEEREAMLKQLAGVQDKITLAQGGDLNGPEAIRRTLHDAIDRTELGDRSDTVNAQQFKLSIPIGGPVAPGVALYGAPGGSHSEGMVVNVQANNDCVQLTMGKMTENSASAGLSLGVASDVLPEHDKDDIPPILSINLPGASVKGEVKQRVDPAVVLKVSIEPKDGLRDLAEARGVLKQAVDMLVDFKLGETLDRQGLPYRSAYEMICDRLDAPFTIDDEVRETISTSLEAGMTLGRLAVKTGVDQEANEDTGQEKKEKDHARFGISPLSAKLVRSTDIMRSRNQQGATEKYDTRKNTVKLEAFLGANTAHTTVKKAGDPEISAQAQEDENGEGSSSSSVKAGKAKSLLTFPLTAGISGGIDLNIGGSEVKDKFPVGTDKFVAYKKEYGNYSRDMDQAIGVMLESLPAVSNRVQEVVDKGFRKVMEAGLSAKALTRAPKGPPSPAQLALRQQIAGLKGEVNALQDDIDALTTRLEAHRAGGAPAQGLDAELNGILDELEDRQEVIDRKKADLADRGAQLAGLDHKQSLKELVDKDLATMEGEVLMNFGRALMEQKTDRFSVKLESKQQWAHRGIDAAIDLADQQGDEGMAQIMRVVAAQVFANDKDQAVKYLIAAGDMNVKQSQFNFKNPLYFKRREVKGMTEDPVPDTRTATLNPTAKRLLDKREGTLQMDQVAMEIAKTSLAMVRSGKGIG